MASQTLKCPKCHHTVTITGKPRDKIYLTCPKCNTKGIFSFPAKQAEPKKTSREYILKVDNLTKEYNHFKAVDMVSFSVKTGEIFGFLGPNGAGKTTTIKAILGLITVNSGNIIINGINIRQNEKEVKKYIGYLPEKVAFYDNLTALQNMNFYAELKKAPKEQCKPLIEEFGLKDSINKKVGKFSKGMVQRLGMARAILGLPPILILDEPSGGLDPKGVTLVRQKIKEMKTKGTTIFLSSHILGEVQEVCDRVAIINKGALVAEDSVAQLSQKLNLKPKLAIQLENITDKQIKAVKKVTGVEDTKVDGNMLHVICDPKSKSKVIIAIEKAGGNVVNIQIKEPSLEEVFLRYTEET